MSSSGQPADFEAVKSRLAEIADAVDDESLSLDAALDLYEEAVTLGMQASDLLETGIEVPDEAVGTASAVEAGEQPSETQQGVHSLTSESASTDSDSLSANSSSAANGEVSQPQ